MSENLDLDDDEYELAHQKINVICDKINVILRKELKGDPNEEYIVEHLSEQFRFWNY